MSSESSEHLSDEDDSEPNDHYFLDNMSDSDSSASDRDSELGKISFFERTTKL